MSNDNQKTMSVQTTHKQLGNILTVCEAVMRDFGLKSKINNSIQFFGEQLLYKNKNHFYQVFEGRQELKVKDLTLIYTITQDNRIKTALTEIFT